jgi:signal peptidase I
MRKRSILRLLVEPLMLAVVLAFGVRSMVRVYSIPSRSMEPTLQVGDRIAVTPYWGGAGPVRSEVVVFRSPTQPSQFLVKRVIALPGELIDCRGGRVTIGGHALAEPYTAVATGNVEPQIVPHDCYFVMGDNRLSSFDSRNWGVLPGRLIVGRARMVLWSARGTRAPAAFASTQNSWPDGLRRERLRLFLPID